MSPIHAPNTTSNIIMVNVNDAEVDESNTLASWWILLNWPRINKNCRDTWQILWRTWNLDILFLRTNTNRVGSVKSELKNFNVCEDTSMLKIFKMQIVKKRMSLQRKQLEIKSMLVLNMKFTPSLWVNFIRNFVRVGTGLTCSLPSFIK